MSQMGLLLLCICGGIFLTAIFVCWLVLATRSGANRQPAPEDRLIASTHIPVAELFTPTSPPFTDHELDLEWITLAASEMRTPLRVLRGYAYYLHQHLNYASRHALLATAEHILQQITRLEGLIDAWSATAQDHNDAQVIRYPCEVVQRIHTVCAHVLTPTEPYCQISAANPIWVQLDTSLFDHALAILIRRACRASGQRSVEIVIRIVAIMEQPTVSIAVADRRQWQQGQVPPMWEELDIELARALIEELGGWLTIEDRAAGGAITTFWLAGQAIIPMPHATSASLPIPPSRRAS